MKFVGEGNGKSFSALSCAAFILAAVTASSAMAATYTWNTGGNAANPADGSGIWDYSTANWSDGTNNVAWSSATPNVDTAVFGHANGAAGTVTLASGIKATGITFNAAGSGTYTLSGGSIDASNSNLTITLNNTNATIASSIINGGSTMIALKSGTQGGGTLTLSGTDNSYAGYFDILGGATLSIESQNRLGSGSGKNRINGGTLVYTGATATWAANNRDIRLYQAGGTLAVEGTGNLTINNLTTNYGQLDFVPVAPRTITLTGSNTGYGMLGSAITDSSLTNANKVTSLVKSGTGKWILAGTNTYTGATTVTNGTLLLHTTNTLQSATGDVNIQGGTLTSDIASAVNLGGNLNLSAAGILDANGASSVGSFALAAGKNFSMTGGTLLLTLTGASTYDTIVADSTSGGTFSITGGTIDLQNSAALDYLSTYQIFKNFTGGSVSGLSFINYDSTNWTANLDTSGVLSFAAVAPVPEAASLGFLTIGASLLIARRRKH